MKLNIGCGYSKKYREGYTTIDNDPGTKPNIIWDLENGLYPVDSNSCEEIVIHHVLEHVGLTPESYKRVWQEIYRVSKPGCKISIIVPHHSSCNYFNDPTHIRVITHHQLQCLSKDFVESHKHPDGAYMYTPFAKIWDVDFEMGRHEYIFDEYWKEQFESGKITPEQLNRAANTYFNVVHELHVELTAVKPRG